MPNKNSDKIIAIADIQRVHKRRHYGVTCTAVVQCGRERHLPANICTTDPAVPSDRITVGVFMGGHWPPPDIAPGACHPALFPETVSALARRAEVWPVRSPIVEGCFMAGDNRKLIAGCNRFARQSPNIAAHG